MLKDLLLLPLILAASPLYALLRIVTIWVKPHYSKVPNSRAEVTGPLSWFYWAWFGNDHDTKFWPPEQPGYKGLWDDLVRRFRDWHTRNMAHNLSFIVLLRPVVNPIYLLGKPKSGNPADETQQTFVLRFNPFFIAVPIPVVIACAAAVIAGLVMLWLTRNPVWLALLIFLPGAFCYVGWRVETPFDGAWGLSWKGGGKWDWGWKDRS